MKRKLTLHRKSEHLGIFFNKYGQEWARGWYFIHRGHHSDRPGVVYICCPAPDWYTFKLDIGRIPFKTTCNFWLWRGFYPQLGRTGNILIKSGDYILGLYVPRHSLYLTDILYDLNDMDAAYWVLRRIFQVLDIPPTPRLKASEIIVGADPEFLLSNGKEFIQASQVYSSHYDPVGCDGAGDQLELRPNPGTPREVIRNLKYLFKLVQKDGYDIHIGDQFPLGGHIHVGVGYRVKPDRSLLAVFDDFLGRPTRDLCERYGYGGLSDWESKPWGFEYRTPSAIIFADPTIARISLKMIRNITKLAIQEKEITYNPTPTVEDYCRVCGLRKKEAEQFLNFTRDAQKYKTSILGFWKLVPNRKTWPLLVRFEDDWSQNAISYIKEKVRKWRLKKPIKITLFGLCKERGKVNTIPVPGHKIVNVMIDPCWVGVARSIRMRGKDISVFTKALRRHIRRRFNA